MDEVRCIFGFTLRLTIENVFSWNALELHIRVRGEAKAGSQHVEGGLAQKEKGGIKRSAVSKALP
jgi:hypothetical protein